MFFFNALNAIILLALIYSFLLFYFFSFLLIFFFFFFFFFSSRRRHTRCGRDWSSDVCSSDLLINSFLEIKSDSLYITYADNELAAIKKPTNNKDTISSKTDYLVIQKRDRKSVV